MRRSLLVGTLLFLALAGAGIAWAVYRAGADLAHLPGLGAGTWMTVIGLVPLIYAFDALRYRLLAAAVGTPIGWGAAIEASMANFFFSWLTPGAALGAPAAIVTLHRRGVPLAAAGLVAFGKSATSTLILLLLAFMALALGLGPPLPTAVLTPLVAGLAIVVTILAVPVVAALSRRFRSVLARPGGRWRAGLHDAAERLARLPVRALPAIFLSHLLYFCAFVGVLVVLAAALGAAPIGPTVGVSTVFSAFSYVAPTPGGAGLSEASADLFFTGLLAPGPAVAAVLLFRGLTFYLQVIIGLLYIIAAGGLPFFLKEAT